MLVMQILEFVFSSFWTWAGTAILLATVTEGVSRVLAAAVMTIRSRY